MTKGGLQGEVAIAGGLLTAVTVATIAVVLIAMGGPVDPATVPSEVLTVRTVKGARVAAPAATRKPEAPQPVASRAPADPPPSGPPTSVEGPLPVEAPADDAMLRGTVESTTAAPIPGAEVRVLKGRRTLGQAVTGPDGSFVVGPIDGGHYRVSVTHPEYAKEEFARTGVPRDPIKVVLQEGGGIAGQVVDDWSGEPVARASVRAGLAREAATRGRRTLDEGVRADEGGAFKIEGLPAGDYLITASERGYAVSAEQAVTVGAGKTAAGVTIRLKKEAILEGRVIDDGNGEAVAKALLVFRPPFPSGPRRARTRRDGTFILKGVSPGRSSVEVSRSGYLTKIVSGLDVQPGETKKGLEIRLQKPGASADPAPPGGSGSGSGSGSGYGADPGWGRPLPPGHPARPSGPGGVPPGPMAHGQPFQYAGIGAVVKGDKASGGIVIDKVFPGGAAAGIGLARGTVILEVDGQPVGAGDLGRAVEMLRGEDGSPVTLKVVGPDGRPQLIQPIRKAMTVGPSRPRG